MLSIDINKSLNGSDGTMQLDVTIEVKQHSFTVLFGQSGSGKTTLLRILAGLQPCSGTIRMGDTLWLDGKKAVAPQKRGVGFVFQDYALFENMSVEKNLLYVNPDLKLAEELLKLTGLWELRSRLPQSLSGGQKQRVALCRAMMARPQLLLMDEPLSALDPAMRQKLQHDILQLHRRFETTTIMVSHDPSEIYRLADTVIELQQGKVINQGTPKERFLYAKGSQKFSLQGQVLEILPRDAIYVAVVAIGQQIVEVVLDRHAARNFEVGEQVVVSTKAFAPVLHKV